MSDDIIIERPIIVHNVTQALYDQLATRQVCECLKVYRPIVMVTAGEGERLLLYECIAAVVMQHSMIA